MVLMQRALSRVGGALDNDTNPQVPRATPAQSHERFRQTPTPDDRLSRQLAVAVQTRAIAHREGPATRPWGQAASKRPLAVRPANATLSRTLIIIEPKDKGEEHELSEEFAQDEFFLNFAKAIEVGAVDMSFSLKDARRPLTAIDDDIYVLTHSGYDTEGEKPEPWAAGLSLNRFAKVLATKCGGAAKLNGKRVWILGCYIGQDITLLAAAFAKAGVRDCSVYAPMSLMFISTRGIPHVHQDKDADVDSGNKEVAYAEAKYGLNTHNFRGTGENWEGAILQAGQATRIPGKVVERTVAEHFDPKGKETDD